MQFLALFLFALISSSDLFMAWGGRGVQKNDWIFFLLWILPVAFFAATSIRRKKLPVINRYPLLLSLFFVFFGVIGSLNTLSYIGLALAFLSPLPLSMAVIIWAVSSLLWMPLSTWIGLWYFPQYLSIGKLLLLGVCSTGAVISLHQIDKRRIEI